MFVVESILSSQFAWVSIFSSSNRSLKLAYMNLPKLSIVCCVCTNKTHYIFYCSLLKSANFINLENACEYFVIESLLVVDSAGLCAASEIPFRGSRNNPTRSLRLIFHCSFTLLWNLQWYKTAGFNISFRTVYFWCSLTEPSFSRSCHFQKSFLCGPYMSHIQGFGNIITLY